MILPYFSIRSLICPKPAARQFLAAFSVTIIWLLFENSPANADNLGPNVIIESLAQRSGPRGNTLFLQLSPEETGVVSENNFADPDMWGSRARELEVGAIGTGVTIGDYDNDGLPDLFVVSKTEASRLFRNLGNFIFEDVTDSAGLIDPEETASLWKQGAGFADVNNDGWLDLYLCRFNAPNRLYINQGDGTFSEEAHNYGLDLVDASVMAAFCDYDRDGWLDVFIQTNVLDTVGQPDGQRDYLFRNNGDGTFANVTDAAGVAPGQTHGNSAVWWDFNDDDWPDLYVANDFGPPDFLFRNNHDGTFTDVALQSLPRSPLSSMGSDLGDIDNDGLIDFFASDMATSSHEADQRTMAATRTRLRDPDESPNELSQFPTNQLYLNSGTSSLREVSHLAGLSGTDWTWSPRWEDLDNDGRLDLHVTNGMYRELHNVDLVSTRMSARNAMLRVRIMRASPVFAERNHAYRNLGDLRFEDSGTDWGLDQKGVSFGSAFGDLDGDGDLDLLYANYESGPTLLRNDNDQGNRVVIRLHGVSSNRFGIGAKVQLKTASGIQSRELTLARGYMSSSEPIIHFGLGEDDSIDELTITWPSGHIQRIDNLPTNHRITITEPESNQPAEKSDHKSSGAQFVDISESANLAWKTEEDDFDEYANQPLLPQQFGRQGPAIAVGDVNGDGYDDVLIGGTAIDPLKLLLNDGSGAFTLSKSPQFESSNGVDDGPLLLIDVEGDGDLDLLATASGANLPLDSPEYQPRLWLNDGKGNFQSAPADALPSVPISAGAVAAADFDRDGLMDVFIGGRVSPGMYPFTPYSAILSNRGGVFEDVTEQISTDIGFVGMVTSAICSDVDSDGWPDLLITLDWGEVKYFRNQEGKRFEDWTESAGLDKAGNGWWSSISAADFNNDGRPDFAVGNAGLNTPYQADSDNPIVLFAGDFNGRGDQDIIEGYYENGSLYPRRNRQELSKVNRYITIRFPKNDEFAKATLPEMFDQEKLDESTQLVVSELRSGVFLSQPDGHFHFAPLPRIAQIAPIESTVAKDFNNDGHIDLFAAQNSYAPAPVYGRFEGGLGQLLLGDGKGSFAPISPDQSGLVIPKDANAATAIDVDKDGWFDIFVSRNNASTLAFRNSGNQAK